MNIPNFLTILRIVFIPLFIILLSYDRFGSAFLVFGLAAFTDGLDGFLARVLNQKTPHGAYLDPIADKLLLVTSFIAFSILDLIPIWLTILVVSRDVIISVGIIVLRLNLFHIEIRPTILSKCTTCSQMLSITGAFLFYLFGKGDIGLNILYCATGLLTVLSGIHYISRGLTIISDKESSAGE